MGNLVEWFDVYTYTTFAAYFEDQFFSPDDPHKSIYIYAIFWATFIMRPFGSWFFGRWADRHGRRSALIMAVTIMAVGSLVISVLPTRGTIGVGAPILLLICRIVQGFATGGEYGTSATYMSEASTKGHRGFFSSFQYFTLVGGLVTAQAVLLLLSSLMSEATIHAWGWRIPFFIGGVAALIVFFMQKTMDESLSTEHLKSVRSGEDSSSGSLKELFGNHLGNFLLAFTIASGGTLCFYVYTVNAPNIVHSTFSSTPMAATAVNLIALFILMLGQPLGGLIGDRIGRKPVLLFFAAGGVVYTWVLVTCLSHARKPVTAFLMLLMGYIFLTGYTSISAVVKSDLFPTDVRALGVGMAHGFANSLFGGTAPLIYVWAKQGDAIPAFIGYVTALSAVTLLTILFGLTTRTASHLDAPTKGGHD